MNHASLFSGIGGFDLAAKWMRWNNIFHCEIEAFPRKVLQHHFPEAITYEDITKTNFAIHRGSVDVLTGGFPCQPYSQAGKRLGKSDHRHLFPEMLRAIREIRPRWIVGENVFGLVTWNKGLVFNEVQSDLEAEGYKVQSFILPACAVGAPHRRDRVWIVAYSVSTGARHQEHPSCNQEWGPCGDREKSLRQTHGTPSASGAYATSANDAFVANTDNTRDSALRGGTDGNGTQSSVQRKQPLSKPSRLCDTGIASDTSEQQSQGCIKHRSSKSKRQIEKQSGQFSRSICTAWQKFPTQSPICGGDDGLSRQLDGITFPKWRNESIKAYGNAIVPQVALQIFQAIEQYDNRLK